MKITIRDATKDDERFVLKSMAKALEPFYGGDHEAHAKRLLKTHLRGGRDVHGHFSYEQKIFILEMDGLAVGMINVVGKVQGTFKISPIIVSEKYFRRGIGNKLLKFAEQYCMSKHARMIYCTTTENNKKSIAFFKSNGFVNATRSVDHYKVGRNELSFYKEFDSKNLWDVRKMGSISILEYEQKYEDGFRNILYRYLEKDLFPEPERLVDAILEGYARRLKKDVNSKYKLIFLAINEAEEVVGVACATPKKGDPIKLMPFVSKNRDVFFVMLANIPRMLGGLGHKIYIHINPNIFEVKCLQRMNWKLDGLLPGAYHRNRITQQWSLALESEEKMPRIMRLKQRFLQMISAQKKDLEVRVGYEDIRKIKVGDKIQFMSASDQLVVNVIGIRKYLSHKEMLAKESYLRIVPDAKSGDEVLGVLQSIYPQQKEKLGVYVFEIRRE